MKAYKCFFLTVSVLRLSGTATAQEEKIVKPQLVLSQAIQGMPKGENQQVRVLTANFRPQDRTLFHTHRFPVTVYVVEGVFTLEVEGREPKTAKAGEAIVMPSGLRMTVHNRSTSDPLRVIVFYVSDPDTPFLDPIH